MPFGLWRYFKLAFSPLIHPPQKRRERTVADSRHTTGREAPSAETSLAAYFGISGHTYGTVAAV